MVYSGIYGLVSEVSGVGDAANMKRSCAECGKVVAGTENGQKFCPFCGHKFEKILPQHVKRERIVKLLNESEKVGK